MFNRQAGVRRAGLSLEEVRDPTGAGDTFAGGFLGYLAATGNRRRDVDAASDHLRKRHGLIYRRSL